MLKKIDFKDLKLEDVKGEVVIRDQSINLSDLCMSSNIGSGDLTMVYTTKTDQEATMGFELSLNDILVERLISLFPDIDTLVPMLRSFEGMGRLPDGRQLARRILRCPCCCRL